MKATFVSKEKNDVKFTMEFTAEEFDGAIVKAYQANKGKFAIDGFRKGKAPRKIIEARYGNDIFFEDAINDLFSTNYIKALDELKLEVIDRPQADFSELKAGAGFTVTITVPVYPEIEVKDYVGVEIEKVSTEVSADDVANELKALQKRNARMVVADRPAENGDTVILDYAGFVGEEQFEGGTAESQSLKLGSGTFIPGFEEQLVGCKAGDEKDVTVTFPEEYHAPDLAGKEAVFKCRLHEVKAEELPELNDDFAKDVSEFDTIEELKEDAKKKLEETAKASSENEMKNKALEKVVEANPIEVPAAMIENEIDNMINEFDQQLRYQGASLQQYFQFSGASEKEFRDNLRDDAEKKTRTGMIVRAVAEQEKFEATEEEVEKELEKMAALYKIELEKIKKMLGGDDFESFRKDIKMKKAIEFIFEKAVIK